MSRKDRMELLSAGTVYRRMVRNVALFGLFVELAEGQRDGLLLFDRHLSK